MDRFYPQNTYLSLTRLDLSKEENMLFVCSEAVESKQVRFESSHTVIFFSGQ